MHRVALGEGAAFRSIYEHYRDDIYALALKITGVESSAEDVVQEVFIKVWNNREKLIELDSFAAWVKVVTRHHVYNSLRKLSQEEKFLRHLLAQAKPETGTIEEIAYNELHNLLQKAISELTPQQRKVYLLSRTEGLSHKEIAEALGLTPETTRGYMKDALKSIRGFLGRHEDIFLSMAAVLVMKL